MDWIRQIEEFLGYGEAYAAVLRGG